MKMDDNEKLSSVQQNFSQDEGLSVLTSVQSNKLSKHLAKPRKSFEAHAWDGDLVRCWREIFKSDKRVLDALESSIVDSNCTKTFADWAVTIDQFYTFQGVEPTNGLHYSSVRAACALVKELFNPGHLEPFTVTNGEDLMNMWSSPKASAGVVNIQHSKGESIEEILQVFFKMKKLIKAGRGTDAQLPAMMFHRAQISGFLKDGLYYPEGLKKKNRFVWGLDGASVSIEGQYAKPYIEAVSSGCNQYAGGKAPDVIRRLIKDAHESKDYWVSTDYSGFDQTVPSWLIYWCFDVIKDSFDRQYWNELDWIAYNFVNTKVAIPGVGVLQKHKGIPSGSNFTQLVGSMANAVMALSFIASTCKVDSFEAKIDYVRQVAGLNRKNGITMFVMGDDNLLFTGKKLNLADYSEYVLKVYGVKIKPEKCDVGDRFTYPVFLKREWRHRGEYQDPMYLVINTSHPERKRSYEGYSPWHIIYGLYLTYSESFPNTISERFIVEQMEKYGGIQALERIPRTAMPGVFRSMGEKALKRMQLRAELLLNVA